MNALDGLAAAHPAFAWIALAGVLLIAELGTGSGYLLWPAASAAALAVVTGVAPGLNVFVQLALFAVLTAGSTFAARRWLPRRERDVTRADLNDAARRIVGHEGEAVAGGAEPRVFVDGKEWSAEPEGDAALAPGVRVRVTAVLGGARLKVRPV